jgi:transposase
VRTTYELPVEERQCCGQTMAEMGEVVTRELERLEVTVVHEIARRKYACRQCEEHLALAPGPTRVIEKRLLGSGFLAQVLAERFGHHTPYHRLEQKYAAEGLRLSRAVLCTSAKSAAELLEPVWRALGAEVRASPVVHTDAANVVVAQSDYGGRGRGQVWVYADHGDRLWYDFTDGTGCGTGRWRS